MKVMKNIHLIPTDKPSRLYKQTGVLLLDTISDISKDGISINQHIYITSDEEIKEGDWLIVNDEDVMQMKSSYDNDMSEENIWVGDSLNGYATYKDNCKKITLATDQDLIKEGIQKIDDEFLEWFVKNPSCERVEVSKFCRNGDDCPSLDIYNKQGLCNIGYKIIIPKEESKQETLINDTDSHSWGFENFEVIKTEEDAKIFIEALEKITEPNEKLKKAFREYEKQETLEEFINESDTPQGLDQFSYDKGLEDGAKWQQERMYSEEEVYTIIIDLLKRKQVGQILDWGDVEKWFEQFKKK